MKNEYKCRKCGGKECRRRNFKIKGKGMSDYRRKLSNQTPSQINRLHLSKVICKKCGHAQRFKIK